MSTVKTFLRTLSRRRPTHWLDWVGVATLLAVAGLIFIHYPVGDSRRWLAVSIVLGVLALLFPHPNSAGVWCRHPLRYGLLTVSQIALFALEANTTALIVIFFLLSAEALAVLPGWAGYGWIALWGALTILFVGRITGDWPLALLNGLGAMSGYLFIGSAANAQRRAEAANAESQRLLGELQAAHRQLQEYALHAEELAVMQERNRLAREVHDTLGHRLTVAAVQLEGAQRLIERDPAKASQMVTTVRTQVVEGLNELRRTVAALRAPLESELSLPHALTRLAANFQEATTIATQLDLPPRLPPLPDEHRHTLYRTAQEALTNVQRHAGAQRVWLQLAVATQASHPPTGKSGVHLTVADDGRGLPTAAIGRGFGLRGLQERADQLHGALHLSERPGGGAQIQLFLPLQASSDSGFYAACSRES